MDLIWSYGLYGFTLFDAICVYMPGWEKKHLKPGWCSTRPLPRSSGPSEETPAANGGVHNAPAHPEQNAKSVLQSHWKEMLLFGELVCKVVWKSLTGPNIRPRDPDQGGQRLLWRSLIATIQLHPAICWTTIAPLPRGILQSQSAPAAVGEGAHNSAINESTTTEICRCQQVRSWALLAPYICLLDFILSDEYPAENCNWIPESRVGRWYVWWKWSYQPLLAFSSWFSSLRKAYLQQNVLWIPRKTTNFMAVSFTPQ